MSFPRYPPEGTPCTPAGVIKLLFFSFLFFLRIWIDSRVVVALTVCLYPLFKEHICLVKAVFLGTIILRHHIKSLRMALRGSFGILWCVSCPVLACYGVLCPALAGSGYPAWYPLVCLGWLWYVSWCAMVMLWYVSLLSSGCLMVCLGWLWVCSGMSHCWLCPDDVMCKSRPYSKLIFKSYIFILN